MALCHLCSANLDSNVTRSVVRGRDEVDPVVKGLYSLPKRWQRSDGQRPDVVAVVALMALHLKLPRAAKTQR